MDDTAYWLALLRAPGIGPVHCQALLARFGNPRAVFEQHRTVGEPRISSSLDSTPWDAVDRDLRWLERPDRHLVTLHDPRYPPLLKEIHDPPPALFVSGDPDRLRQWQVALVGSRNPTPAGRETAAGLAAALVRHGLAVTSGLAAGIDAAAHRGALAADGITVAVAGTGLDRVYPARHRRLAGEIAGHGALLSEFPLGTPPLPEHFPRRNRIISGLTLGTVVIEAAVRSGSLITARTALEQGREVFAVPGSIHNPLAHGCHALIRAGAKLVEDIHDILEELGPLAGAVNADTGGRSGANDGLGADARAVLEQIDYDVTSIDVLVERTGYPVEQLCPILLELELANYISPAPGGAYARRTERT